MREEFLLAVKSTLDKKGSTLALAQATATKFVDLDDSTAVEEVMSSTDDAIIWELSGFDEVPADPLYHLAFNIGARTSNDAANYGILSLVGKVKEVFPLGSKVEIRNYAEDVESPVLGVMFITFVAVNPQLYDRTSGIRMVTVTARAQRYVQG
jgi:hypothetical protein